jgi:hypothetical protein
MIVASSDLLEFTSSKTDRFILLSVRGTRKIFLHIHSSKVAIFFLSFRVQQHLFSVIMSGVLRTVMLLMTLLARH